MKAVLTIQTNNNIILRFLTRESLNEVTLSRQGSKNYATIAGVKFLVKSMQ